MQTGKQIYLARKYCMKYVDFIKIFTHANPLIMKKCRIQRKSRLSESKNTQEKEICDKTTECKDALSNIKNNKSPGLDCLGDEFYKSLFFILIGFLFYGVLLTCF